MKELGYPIDHQKIDDRGWYPEALACLIILVCAEVFKWTQKEVREMAYQSPKYSFIVKVLMTHFSNIEKNFKLAPFYLRRHFDFSKMEVAGFNMEEKYGIIRLKDFHKWHY